MDSDFIHQLTIHEPLSENEVNLVLDKVERISLDKDDHILREGEVCKSVFLVLSGLMMYYKLSESGEEKIADFALGNEWVSQYQSMVAQTPSPFSIRAIEKTRLYGLSAENLQILYSEIPVFERIARKIVEKAFFTNVRRMDDFQHLKADERYESFVKSQPQLIQRVPQYYIASFLGIAPQSLSRIRKNTKS